MLGKVDDVEDRRQIQDRQGDRYGTSRQSGFDGLVSRASQDHCKRKSRD